MDNLGFKNLVKWEHHDPEGNLVGSGESYNTTQTETINGICDMLHSGTVTNKTIEGMAIGTGSGQNAAATALATSVSDEACADGTGELTDNGTNVVGEVTFTNASGGSWSIEEAGLFGEDATCDDHMLFYNDSISETLGDGDTLTITWTVTPADA
jgi:hypothetical protein